MAAHIELLDGFEDYPGINTAGVGLASHWNLGNSALTSVVAGRVGGQAMSLSSTNATAFRSLEADNEKSIFFALFLNASSWGAQVGDGEFFRLCNVANNHFALKVNYLRELIITGGDGSELARIPDILYLQTWYSISITWLGGTSLGALQVRINGELIANLTNVNVQHSSSVNANRFYVQPPTSAGLYVPVLIDDVRIDTETHDPIPEGRYAIVEYASDDAVQFTKLSGASNYLMIDDPTCDLDTTYNSSNTVGHRDIFNVNALAFNPDRIMAVQLTLIARKEDVATRRLKSVLKSGASEVTGADMYLSTSYTLDRTILQLDPDTGLEFTKAGLAAVKPGYELVE